MNFERDQPVGFTLFAPRQQSVAPVEDLLLQTDKPVQPTFKRRIFNRQFARDQLVAFFERHRRHRADTERFDVKLRPGLHQQVEDVVLHLNRMMDFPAKFTDEIDAQRIDLCQANAHLLASQPRKSFARQGGIRELCKHITRTRPREHEYTHRCR